MKRFLSISRLICRRDHGERKEFFLIINDFFENKRETKCHRIVDGYLEIIAINCNSVVVHFN
jgi:hypothetical protein